MIFPGTLSLMILVNQISFRMVICSSDTEIEELTKILRPLIAQLLLFIHLFHLVTSITPIQTRHSIFTLHRGSPVPPAGENLSSVPSVSSATNSTNSSRCTWTSTESKCVIESMKVHFSRLTGTKSSKGKRALWESIFSEFQALCRENDVETNKNANQVKEK